MRNGFNQRIVVILGGNILNSGIVDYCWDKGFFVVVVDWSPDAFLKGNLFLCIDVKDHETIIKTLEDKGINSIYGAYSSIDLAVPSVNAINRHYGLECMEADVIERALSKAAMTRVWQEKGLLNRFSRKYVDYNSEIVEMSSKMKMIIKPNASSSSRGITIVEKGTESSLVFSAFEKAKLESYDEAVIVEEYVEGREFTCELLGDKQGNVSVYAVSVKYHTNNTNKNKIAVKLHYNSDIYTDEVYNTIADMGKKCYKALGFKSSFGHLEIIMREDGTLSPIEIGARSSGFIANPLASLASGEDFFGAYLEMINGAKVTGDDFINGSISSMYFFYDMPSQTRVVHPCSLVEFLPKGIVSVYNNRTKLFQKGLEFSEINNDNERIGYEILTGERHLMNIQTIENSEQNFIAKIIGK